MLTMHVGFVLHGGKAFICARRLQWIKRMRGKWLSCADGSNVLNMAFVRHALTCKSHTDLCMELPDPQSTC